MIANIRLQHFRSYTDTPFEFEPGVNVIMGPNASGKTNLLEALYLIAQGSTYKPVKATELVQHGQDWARVDAQLHDGQIRTLKIRPQNTSAKEMVIDEKVVKRIQVSQMLPAVLFEPSQLYLLTSSPDMRRSFLDTILVQTAPGFQKLQRDFMRTLKQRNALLKSPDAARARQQVFAWNVRLSELAGQYVAERVRLIDYINTTFAKLYNHIAHGTNQVALRYVSSLPVELYASTLLKRLETSFDTDYARGFTTIGPQRDDVLIMIDGNELRETASRGEVRTTLLALKIQEAQLLEEKTGNKPIFLLDDVFSELDGARRHALTDFLQSHQTFITTTDADLITQHFAQKSNVLAL
jgi:DNA replication and repair protein RecF